MCTQKLVLNRKTSVIKQYSVNKHLRVAVEIEQENADPMESQSYKNWKELEDMHRAPMEDIASWVDFNDEVQISLLVFILAFNHDFLHLKDRC